MKVKALVGFGGAFSMYRGEVKECNNDVILQDLLKIGYVEEVKEVKNEELVVPKILVTDEFVGKIVEKLNEKALEIIEPDKIKEEVKEEDKKTSREKTPKKVENEA